MDNLSWGFGGSFVWLVHWLGLLNSAGVITSWLASWSAVGRSLVVVWVIHLGVLVGIVHLSVHVLVVVVDLLGSLSSLLADVRALGVASRIALAGWLLLVVLLLIMW